MEAAGRVDDEKATRPLSQLRQGDTLFCRSTAELEIDGMMAGTRGELTLASRVVSEDLSFTLEPV